MITFLVYRKCVRGKQGPGGDTEGGREEEGREGKREMGTDRLSETKQQKSRAKQMDREKIQTFNRKE